MNENRTRPFLIKCSNLDMIGPDRPDGPEVQKPRLDHPRNLVDNLKLFFLGIFSDEHAIKIHDSLIK